MNLRTYFAILFAMTFTCCVLLAQETEISGRDVPAPVLAAFDKTYARAKVLEWQKEIHGGKLYYEAETMDGKVPRNILYSPDGAVAQIEEKIAPTEIPPAVAQAVKKQGPNATIRSVRKVTQGELVQYVIDLKGGAQKKLVVRSDGTITSDEGKMP